jgi:hypothetical protein
MKSILAAVALASLVSTSAIPEDTIQQQGNLAELAAKLQQLSPADRQALQSRLSADQNSQALSALLQAMQANPQAPQNPQALYGGKTVEEIFKEALKQNDSHMSLQLNRPEYEYKLPTVGNPVMPTLPGQPTVTLPNPGGPVGPNPPCELPPYCRHVTTPGPLCKCPDDSNSGGNQ